jgi:hypothetical protein
MDNTVMWRAMHRLTGIQLGYELALKRSGQLQGRSGGDGNHDGNASSADPFKIANDTPAHGNNNFHHR